MNRLVTVNEFVSEMKAAMDKAEDDAGIPRGSFLRAWIEQFNKRFDDEAAD